MSESGVKFPSNVVFSTWILLEFDEAVAIIGGSFFPSFGMELGGRTPKLLIYVPG